MAVAIVVVSLFAVLGAVALALEMGMLYHVEDQLQGACDAAVLAAAVELMDEDILWSGGEGYLYDDIPAARSHAQKYAAINSGAWRPVRLSANEENDPDGDIVVGWADDPTELYHGFAPWEPGIEKANTVCVRARRTRQRRNPVGLWLGQLIGVAEANVVAEAWAAIDQRIYGFRPVGKTHAPVVPFAVQGSGTAQAWFEQAFSPAVAGVNDNYTVDHHTGDVSFGPDGIPEIELISAPAPQDEQSAVGNFCAILLQAGAWDIHDVERQLAEGLSSHDLAELGGQLALGPDGTLVLPAHCDLPPQLVAGFLAVRGANRVWPLCRQLPADNGTGICTIEGFGAGRVVSASINDQGGLVVLVQPSLLETCTGLVRPLSGGAKLNPWIGKLFIAH